MAISAALQSDPAPIEACTIARDIQNFDLLIEDMETELGERWGDLSFADSLVFLQEPDAKSLRFIAVAVDAADEDNLESVCAVIDAARERSIKVILIAPFATIFAFMVGISLGLPAQEVPATFSSRTPSPGASDEDSAYPSIAELTPAGTLMPERMSSSRTPSRALRMGSCSLPRIGEREDRMVSSATSAGSETGS